jgi:hypothetical protein
MKRTFLALCFALAAVFAVSGTANVAQAGFLWETAP